MSPYTTGSCPHERRPGTTVCLHCRHEALAAARARQRRTIANVGIVALAVALAIGAWMGGRSNSDASPERGQATETAATAAAGGLPPTVERGVLVEGGRAGGGVRRSTAAAPPVEPLVAQGRTMLRDSLFAVRSGDTVTVHFDTPLTRTRRRDKFERVVRATLPAIYGPGVDSLLTTIPPGELAREGDLLTELPERGLHFPLADGWTLAVWPATRPGQDGPLVVTYTAIVSRAQSLR